MDIFDEEILKFWHSLEQNGVRYIMVGGYAANFNGYQRYTGDMDLWIEDLPENRKRLRKAMKEYGMGDFEAVERMRFFAGWTDFYLNNGLKLDIMVTMKGLENYSFDECLSVANIATIENVNIPFLHINQLIQNKVAVNRPKDQLDVIYLRRIIELMEKEEEEKKKGRQNE
jgi:hypothetical protein